MLKNGDHLTGTVEEKIGDVITLKTDYAGEIKIEWAEVASIVTDHPINVVLSDDTSINGTLLSSQPGTVRIRSGEIIETAPFPPDKIAAIHSLPLEPRPAVTYKTQLSAGGSVSSGNADEKNFYLSGQFTARTESSRYRLGGDLLESSESGHETANRVSLHASYDQFFTKKFYGYANTLFLKDRFKDINLRSTVGLGVGHQFFESKDLNLSLDAGLSYINTDFRIAPDRSAPAFHYAINYDEFFWDERLQLFHRQQGYVSAYDPSDFFVLSQTGILLPLTKKFNATAQINLNYENDPVPGTTALDKVFLFTVGYAM